LRTPRSHALTQVKHRGVRFSSFLLGNQREGEIIAEARFVRSGKRVTVVPTPVTGAQGQLLAEVTTTHVPAI